MNKKDFIKEQYSKFSRTEGSQFITSEYALGEILNFINIYKNEYLFIQSVFHDSDLLDGIYKFKSGIKYV